MKPKTNEEKAKYIAEQCRPCSDEFYSGFYQGALIALNAETKNEIVENQQNGNKKRMFEILDKMNLEDEKNGSRTVAVANTLVEMKKTKNGALITIGCDYQSMIDLIDNKARVVLCVVDLQAYEAHKKEDKS